MAVLRTKIFKGDAYASLKANSKVPYSILSENLLSSLSLKSNLSDLQDSFDNCCELIRKRLKNFFSRDMAKWKKGLEKRKPNEFEHFKNEVFFDLEFEAPEILKDPDSQGSSSQGSGSTPSSSQRDRSDIEEDVPMSSISRKRKSFEDLGPRAKRLRTDNIFSVVKDAAKTEDLDVKQFVAYLGYRASHQQDKQTAKIFHRIYKGEKPDVVRPIPVPLALYLKEECEIGKLVYTDQRLLLKNLVTFPPYYKLANLCQEIMPSIHDFCNGISADLMEVIEITMRRHVEDNEELYDDDDVLSSGVLAKFIAGEDTSGRHMQMNQKGSSDEGLVDTRHMNVVGVGFTQTKTNGEDSQFVFIEEKVGSVNNERPLMIIPGTDSMERSAQILGKLESMITLCESSELYIPMSTNTDEDRRVLKVNIEVELSQMDGKALTTATGLGGAYCTGCTVSEKDAAKLEVIRRGFKFDRSITSVWQLFDNLTGYDDGDELAEIVPVAAIPETIDYTIHHVSNSLTSNAWFQVPSSSTNTTTASGDAVVGEQDRIGVEVPKKKNDYAVRQGLTQCPQIRSKDITKNIPVTHGWIRSLYFFEQIAYHLNSGVHIWGKGLKIGAENKRKLKVF